MKVWLKTGVRVHSRFTVNIVKDIIDLLGITDDDNTEEVFFKALEHASFWIEIFNAEGSNDHIKTLQTHEPCLKVASSIASMQNILKRKGLGHSLIQKLKLKENDMLQLLSYNVVTGISDSKQRMRSAWMSCFTTLSACLENINVIREIFQTLKTPVGLGRIPVEGRTTGPSRPHCWWGGARAYTLGPERW